MVSFSIHLQNRSVHCSSSGVSLGSSCFYSRFHLSIYIKYYRVIREVLKKVCQLYMGYGGFKSKSLKPYTLSLDDWMILKLHTTKLECIL